MNKPTHRTQRTPRSKYAVLHPIAAAAGLLTTTAMAHAACSPGLPTVCTGTDTVGIHDNASRVVVDPGATVSTSNLGGNEATLRIGVLQDNAGTIKAKVLLELANGPVTPDGDKILNDKGIIVLPDILANAGGVTVSYFEWVQNRQGYYWDLEEIHARLLKIVEREGRAVWNIAQSRKVSARSAAYIHALGRLANAIEAHGTQPFFAG